MDTFRSTHTILEGVAGSFKYYSLPQLEKLGYTKIDQLPFSIRILLELVLRHHQQDKATAQDVINLASWKPDDAARPVMPFFPGRVLMQDFSGLPVLVDLAAVRSAMARMGGDPQRVNPVIPVDVVIDHSVQVDFFGSPDALERNAEIEFRRNRERYEMLHWGQKAFKNFRVVPPSTGIVHQVNLEYLADVVLTQDEDGEQVAFPDTLVGTDSHTTMINGLGVAGWGVGGIEAIAAMLGEPIEMLVPDVVGVKLTGALPEGVTPTDLTLTITQMLRKHGVVNKFVEVFGSGLSTLSLADRAMIANMAPEMGATMVYFPVDSQTIDYMRFTGRSEDLIALVEAYCKAQQLFRTDTTPDPQFTALVELDLKSVEPSLAGPKRPQDRVPLSKMQDVFRSALTTPKSERGFALEQDRLDIKAVLQSNGDAVEMRHGSVAIAAITSCTNTSNPYVMVGAGLVAKKAVDKGLSVKPYVKTSLAPGSRVVTEYLQHAGLMEPLSALGFDVVGYGCTTCIGNSGPLPTEVVEAISGTNLVAASVLSGNRNFEGRVSPHTVANYLASPPMVIVYALAGTVDIDLLNEPVGTANDGSPVFLKDIWPTSQEVMDTVKEHLKPEMFQDSYASVFTGNPVWNSIESGSSELYPWDPDSTYIQEPPYFLDLEEKAAPPADIHGARVLALFGDSVTTDHISPAGSIPASSPAGQYLLENGVKVPDFNSYGSRRGNDKILTRGTFANIRIKNLLLPTTEGSVTLHFPSGEKMSIYDAAMKYQEDGIPTIVLAGKEYGTGSSRDWAAKGPLLLGVKAIIAESYERIHRSNLAGMGVLPLQFKDGENAASLGLSGAETFHIEGLAGELEKGQELTVRAVHEDGQEVQFTVTARLDTDIEITYFRNGGLLPTVLLELMAER
jgi:aconitate hydratase